MKFKNMESASSTTISLKGLCVHCCGRVLAQIARTKHAIFHEWRGLVKSNRNLLRLALNEAEAAAWQTPFPHLLFPALATEKAQAVASWSHRQQTLRRKHLGYTGALW